MNAQIPPLAEGRQPETLNVVGGGVVVPTQPQEVAYPLRREEFDIICEGESATKDSRWRDIAISACLSTFLGLIGTAASVSWDTSLGSQKWVISFTTLLLVLFLSTAGIAIFLQSRVKQQTAASACARLKSKIENYFKERSR